MKFYDHYIDFLVDVITLYLEEDREILYISESLGVSKAVVSGAIKYLKIGYSKDKSDYQPYSPTEKNPKQKTPLSERQYQLLSDSYKEIFIAVKKKIKKRKLIKHIEYDCANKIAMEAMSFAPEAMLKFDPSRQDSHISFVANKCIFLMIDWYRISRDTSRLTNERRRIVAATKNELIKEHGYFTADLIRERLYDKYDLTEANRIYDDGMTHTSLMSDHPVNNTTESCKETLIIDRVKQDSSLIDKIVWKDFKKCIYKYILSEYPIEHKHKWRILVFFANNLFPRCEGYNGLSGKLLADRYNVSESSFNLSRKEFMTHCKSIKHRIYAWLEGKYDYDESFNYSLKGI